MRESDRSVLNVASGKKRLRKWALGIGGALLAFGTGLQLARFYFEAPNFERELSEGGFEVRRYAPRIVAETVVEARDRESAANEGFRRLGGYIFGQNRPVATQVSQASTEGQSIAMTVPVEIASPSSENQWRVVFTMPAEYELESLPAPNDDRVVLRELPSERVASLRFSGFLPSDSRVEALKRQLLAQVQAAGFEATSEVSVAVYDPPSALVPFLRRNELHVHVRQRS